VEIKLWGEIAIYKCGITASWKQDNCHWVWKRIHLWQALTQYTNVLTHYKDLPHYKDSPSITVEQAN